MKRAYFMTVIDCACALRGTCV